MSDFIGRLLGNAAGKANAEQLAAFCDRLFFPCGYYIIGIFLIQCAISEIANSALTIQKVKAIYKIIGLGCQKPYS